jgi:condensin complex subunit 1
MSFVNCINEASAKIYDMMFSKTYTEVLEAIEYFTVASQFEIENSKKAVKDMLNLVKSQQQNIREAVANAYKTLYLTSNKATAKARACQVI